MVIQGYPGLLGLPLDVGHTPLTRDTSPVYVHALYIQRDIHTDSGRESVCMYAKERYRQTET